MRGEESVFGACSGPYRRRFVRVRGLSRAFSGSRARVSAGLRLLFSDDKQTTLGSGLGIRIIVRDRAGKQQLVRENVRIDTNGNVGIGTGQNNCSNRG